MMPIILIVLASINKQIKMKWLLYCLPLFLFGCDSNSMMKASNEPPIEIPIDFKKGKQTIKTSIHLDSPLNLCIGMRFYPYKLPKPNIFYHPEPSLEENERLSKVIGLNSYPQESTGVLADFRILIFDKMINLVTTDEAITHPQTDASFGGRYGCFVTKTLPKGDFDVTLEYDPLSDNMRTIYGEFVINQAYHGK